MDAPTTTQLVESARAEITACESCQRSVATFQITWPDEVFVICQGCVPDGLDGFATPIGVSSVGGFS